MGVGEQKGENGLGLESPFADNCIHIEVDD